MPAAVRLKPDTTSAGHFVDAPAAVGSRLAAMRTKFVLLLALSLAATSSAAQNRASKTLDIYVVDVEGGNAVLFVAPSGQSLLIDTGNAGPAAVRDADRIMAAAKDAGITQIDHLITSHYHADHIGGLSELATRIPIRHFIDHGANVQPGANIDPILQRYAEIHAKVKHTVAKPGDRVALDGLDVRVVASAADVLKTPLAGAGQPNPYCVGFKLRNANRTEDDQSVGTHLTFGRFRVLHLADLQWDREFDLMCPNNRIGSVDLWLVSRHGQPTSNSEALVHAIRPRVAIMNNGTRKGGQPDAMKIIHSAPDLEDLWQIHFSQLSGQEHTVPGLFIANPFDEPQTAMPITAEAAPQPGAQAPAAPQHNGAAYWFKVSALPDGTFTVTNSRNGFAKTYQSRTR
jgi:beta-lactamase superfamily II metal-dependent hydrolase